MNKLLRFLFCRDSILFFLQFIPNTRYSINPKTGKTVIVKIHATIVSGDLSETKIAIRNII